MRLAVLASLALLLIAACSVPFIDDDDEDASGATPTEREVRIATFTPTSSEPTPTPDIVETAAAEQTAFLETAEAQEEAAGPSPTPDPDAPEPTPTIELEDPISPPMTRMLLNGETLEPALSSYTWQFSDQALTLARILAPIVDMTDEQFIVSRGTELGIEFYGAEYRRPPDSLEVRVFDFEENSATPISAITGASPDEELAFAIKTEPDQFVKLDPQGDRIFEIDVPPGHYAVQVRGDWGPHPRPELADQFPIYVTWVFNVVVE